MATDADNPCSTFTQDNLEFYQALLADSNAAWECLYIRAFKSFIPYACQRSAISQDDALDILQEGLAEFAVKIKNGKYAFQGSAVTAYVFTVCRNRWVTFLRKNQIRKTDSLSENTGDDDEAPDGPQDGVSHPFIIFKRDDPDETIEEDSSDREAIWEDTEVDWEAVNRAFSEVGNDCKAMLQCFYVEEKSLGECGARIGLQENSAKVKRFRCAQRLKTLYIQYKKSNIMELSDELLEQIGAYLSGQMTPSAKDEFETRLQQDVRLKKEVAVQREIKQGLSFLTQKDRFKAMHADLETRGLLESTHQSEAEPASTETKVVPLSAKTTVFGPTWTYFAAAASVVLLLGFGWVLYQNRAEEQLRLARNQQGFNTFFSATLKPAPVIPVDPDRVGTPQNSAQPNADSLRLQEAITALQRKDTQTALNTLQDLTRKSPGHWSASAQWYLALAYLNTNQRAQAEFLLKQMADLPGHPYQSEARKLIGELAN